MSDRLRRAWLLRDRPAIDERNPEQRTTRQKGERESRTLRLPSASKVKQRLGKFPRPGFGFRKRDLPYAA